MIVLSVLVTGVGYELVIDHPFGQPRPSWLLFVVGGPMLFLVARMRLEYEIFGRVSPSRLIGFVALVALLDALRGRGQPLEVPVSPIGQEAADVRDSEA
ncbi:low temperature requirement protein A [Micromonospora sp. NPDC023888]|uniref:low temperature requirement protein A n=1 Tax=Micromonospora sp. NPDC023888 TaxID=3155607 RepID=UPI0033FCF07C